MRAFLSTSVTDENGAGYTTSYAYDLMGRLKTTIPQEIAAAIDDALKALNEPAPK